METEARSRVQSVQRTVSETGAVIRAFIRATEIPELDAVCRVYLRELTDAIECDECGIVSVDGSSLTLLAAKGHPESGWLTRFVSGVSLVKHDSSAKTTATFDGMGADSSPYSSVICTPVIVKNVAKGVVCLASERTNAFDSQDVKFVEAMSRELSVAFAQSLQGPEPMASRGDMLLGWRARCVLDIDLAHEIARARRRQGQVSILLVAIEPVDGRKSVQQDAITRALSALKSNVRAYDKAYVYGPGQLILLLPGTGKEEALLIARRLRRVIGLRHREGITHNKHDAVGGLRIAAVGFPSDGDSTGKLIELAKSALDSAQDHPDPGDLS